ncbi:MAG: hypothetical protein SOW25_01585, partial [Helicobacter sp.]|nr:hypothetical protein [Helicobacter sp.]
LIEPFLALLVLVLSGLNWFINQKVSYLGERISRLEDFKKYSEDAFLLLREIKGKLDLLLKNSH